MQKTSRGLVFRWSTLKGATALILFIALAAFIEYLIVAYAVSIGVRDDASFQIPWLGLVISPLFHLVPISTVIVLAASWTCMVKYVAMKPSEKMKTPTNKAKVPREERTGLRARVSGFLGKMKLGFTKATVKIAITILLVFLALVLLISALANPWLVYGVFAKLYQNNPQVLGFVKATNSALQGFAEAVAPVGWLCSSIDGAIKAAAPGFRGFISALSALTRPLADLPPVGKYLVFQNLAAWLSALAVLLYGAYTRKSYRHKRK